MALSETPLRELTEQDRREALAATDKWKYADSIVTFDEQKAYYLGYLNKAERTPDDIAHLQKENERLRQALERISRWELPASGLFWDDAKTRPMSFASAFGAYGERDYMRNLATSALNHQPVSTATQKEENE